MLTDTHAHLTDPKFGGAKDIIKTMEADGLSYIISSGYDIATSLESQRLAEENERVFFTAGVHPSEADRKTVPADFKESLIKMAAHPKCVAIGEFGLDNHYPETDKAAQKKLFIEMLEITAQASLPAVFHVREADGDFYDIVKLNRNKLNQGGIMHCFSGSYETAARYADLGFYISFSGALTFNNAKSAPEAAQKLPRDIILVETDCPYLSPHPYRGEVNFPSRVRLVAQRLAELWGVSLEEAADITTKNALRIFKKLGKVRV